MGARVSAAPPVVVLGEALVDVFAEGELPGGAPFNVACHLAGLGLTPRFISRVGNDAAAARLDSAAALCGLSMRHVQRDVHRPTGRVRVHEQAGAHRFEILADQAYDWIDAADARRALEDCDAAACAAGWLYHGSLISRGPAATALAALAALPLRRFVDLNWREAGATPEQALAALRGVHVLKLNDEELELLCSWTGLPVTRAGAAVTGAGDTIARLATRLHAELLVLTHGAAGASAWDARGRCIARQPAAPVSRLVDTVGAGDALAAALLAALVQGVAVPQALALAARFAAALCGQRGALPEHPGFYAPWREQLQQSAVPAAGEA